MALVKLVGDEERKHLPQATKSHPQRTKGSPQKEKEVLRFSQPWTWYWCCAYGAKVGKMRDFCKSNENTMDDLFFLSTRNI